jgi:hypothetical protein
MKIPLSLALSAAFAVAVVPLHAQTVTGSGKNGTVPMWTGGSKIGDSPISALLDTVQVNGSITARATSPSLIGVVKGIAPAGTAVEGQTDSHIGVLGSASDSGYGVYGISKTGEGVYGLSTTSAGVYGESIEDNGVKGETSAKLAAVVGENTGLVGDGVGGIACECSTGAAAVVGEGHLAGAFFGKVQVMGDFLVTGSKAFHIDHPLDPANKYLNHFAIESNEVLDTYSGNVTTDGSGTATVTLPNYFQALNANFRYQLTAIGQFAQAIVAEEIQNNQFVIKTDKPSVKISWQVTGVRSDAYAKAHPVPVEEDKSEQERGYYLTPEVFGQPEEMSIAWLHHGSLMSEAKKLSQQRRQAGAQ